MGMVTCPKCGKVISDQATVCPQCNLNLSSPNFVVCEECETTYEATQGACPNCGRPNSVLQKQKKKRKHIGIVLSIVAILLALIVVFLVFVSKKAQELEYYTNMQAVSYAMLDGAYQAETAGILIQSVWSNAIYQERDEATDPYTMENGKFVDDFNIALGNLLSDDGFTANLSAIRENQDIVTEFMKELKNPPQKYKEAYVALKDYYDSYWKMTQLVVNPTGSLNTFSDNFSTYDTDTVNSYEKMAFHLDV